MPLFVDAFPHLVVHVSVTVLVDLLNQLLDAFNVHGDLHHLQSRTRQISKGKKQTVQRISVCESGKKGSTTRPCLNSSRVSWPLRSLSSEKNRSTSRSCRQGRKRKKKEKKKRRRRESNSTRLFFQKKKKKEHNSKAHVLELRFHHIGRRSEVFVSAAINFSRVSFPPHSLSMQTC
jgi:hypothetical protein